MAIQWSSNLAIGIEEVDNQHKELFEAVNNLLEACNKGKGKEEVEKTIRFLEDYVVTHFSSEEKLQAQCGYPKYAAHKILHDRFIQSFSEIKRQFEKEGATLPFVITINRLVVDWLRSHILSEDKELGVYLKTKI